jgi:hypothetical protein
MSKPSSKLNEPERYKLFILDEEAGEKKLVHYLLPPTTIL